MKRYRYLVIGAVAVLLLIALAAATVTFRTQITAFERWVLAAFAPLQRAAGAAGDAVRSFFASLAELSELRAENVRLRAEVERLRALEPLLDETQAENDRLAAMLGFTSPPPHQGIAARVVNRGLSNWFSTIEVDRGAVDGVVAGNPAVSQHGLVGKVVRVADRTATVLLLTDPQSGVGVHVVRSREPAALVGDSSFQGTCTMRMFSRDADVVPGDAVLTSGLGDVYPADLQVGTVTAVRHEEQGLVIEADVAPAVDFGRLEEVFILIGG